MLLDAGDGDGVCGGTSSGRAQQQLAELRKGARWVDGAKLRCFGPVPGCNEKCGVRRLVNRRKKIYSGYLQIIVSGICIGLFSTIHKFMSPVLF